MSKQVECTLCGHPREVDLDDWVAECEGKRLQGPCRGRRYQIAHLLTKEELGIDD